MDRFLSGHLWWTLALLSLVAFGALATIYYAFCWLVGGVIDAQLLRREREETLRRAGVPDEEIDGRLLARDRHMTLLRGGIAFAAAAAFHFFA